MNDPTAAALSRDFLVSCAAYVALLIIIGLWARRARRASTLTDHVLAGRDIGLGVLLLTLFATQYSGNSLSGFPGQTYRQGLAYFMSVPFMVGIVAGYLLFVPRLFARSRAGRYITPNDFLQDRFAHRALHYIAAAIFIFTLCNFLLAQLMALGHAVAGLTDHRIPYAAGVLGGAAVILIYELLGGMRAVAWTDALQGLSLAVGLAVIVLLLVINVGTPGEVVSRIQQIAPEKAATPDLSTCLTWLSTFMLLSLGGPLYPQAIQRIYAARSARTLRRALAIMAFLPLFAVTAVVFMGAVGIVLFPGLDPAESDQITFRVLGYLATSDPRAYVPTLIVMVAVIAAIMSTADSCLLSLSSILTRDLGRRREPISGRELRGQLRRASWISVSVMVVLATLALTPITTLWGLLVVKFEVLIQLSPAFVLGSAGARDDSRAFSHRDILSGRGVGLGCSAVAIVTGHKRLHGFHAGSAGVLLNYASVLVSRWVRLRTTPESAVATSR